MSVQSEIDRIKKNIADSYAAAQEKGAELPADQNSENLIRTIERIPSGQGRDLIADALTDIGIETPSDSSFSELAKTIRGMDLGFGSVAKTYPSVVNGFLNFAAYSANSISIVVESEAKTVFTDAELYEIGKYTLMKMGVTENLLFSYLYNAAEGQQEKGYFRFLNPTYVTINIALYITPEDGYDFSTETEPACRSAIEEYFKQSFLNEPFSVEKFDNFILGLPSVQAIQRVFPSGNTIGAGNRSFAMGTITLRKKS